MKEKELEEIVGGLGATEQSFIKERYLPEIKNWAALIDQINGYADRFDDFSDNFRNELANNINAFDELLAQVKVLNISEDPASPEHVRNRFNSFKNEYQQLLSKKSLLESSIINIADIEGLKKVVANAKKEAANFEKSFTESLQKRARGSQRTLAKYFAERLKELRSDDQTNPEKWLEKRAFWGWILVLAAAFLIGCYVLFIHRGWIKGFEVQVGLLKLAILAFVYTQYHFATKNYYISSEIIAKYEHLTVISKTMTDFIAAAFEDEILKENVLSNASKTLFSDIKTGYTKQDSTETSLIENIINQIPKKTQ